jgi:hypothetical protein
MEIQSIRLTAIDEQYLVHLPPNKAWEKVPISDCIALLNPAATGALKKTAMLTLADGQQFPGQAIAAAQSDRQTDRQTDDQANLQSSGDRLAWSHQWLGRLDVPLNLIATVTLSPNVQPPPPGVEGDVVLLANGDRQEGLIVAFGDSIIIEPAGRKGEIIDIPINLVSAVTMVSKKQPHGGRRICFNDGTVIDVQSIAIGDDGFVRLTGSWLSTAGTQPSGKGLSQIAAILLDPNGMIALASLQPSRVDGPATRFELPKPQALDPSAPLNLSAIELRGPITVRYALPAGCQRFTAEAELPRESQQWGNLELVVRIDDDEKFRGKLTSQKPHASISVPITGRELTIELLPGANGPIQDRLILKRPMLLKAR